MFGHLLDEMLYVVLAIAFGLIAVMRWDARNQRRFLVDVFGEDIAGSIQRREFRLDEAPEFVGGSFGKSPGRAEPRNPPRYVSPAKMPGYVTVTSAEDLCGRYANGERSFYDVELPGVDLSGVDLGGAQLLGANLAGANLQRSHLVGVNLAGARLEDADLSEALLLYADLSHALLEGASLAAANLRGANVASAILVGANLEDAVLVGVNFEGAKLTGARLAGASAGGDNPLGRTALLGVDLGPFCRAGIGFADRCDVDFRSVLLSIGEPQLKDFLRKTGMPDVFVEYMVDCARSLSPELVFSLLQSTFISYGGPDEAFARKLNDALERRGVNTFFFKDDAPAGEKLHRVMRKGVNGHDRVILVCSKASLQRPGLVNELEETLARESRDGGRTYLLPVRLDDYVIDGWTPKDPDVAAAVRDRVIADFRQHEDQGEFERGVSKLIAVLKRPSA